MTSTNPTPLLHCVHCEYDLREQTHDARCPECGVAVSTSRQADVSANDLGSMADGLRLCGWCGILGSLQIAMMFVATLSDNQELFGFLLVGETLCALLWALGLITLKGAGEQLPLGAPDRRSTRLIHGLQIGGVLAMLVLLPMSVMLEPMRHHAHKLIALLFTGILLLAIASISCVLIGLIVQGRWMATLDQRLRAKPQTSTRWRTLESLGWVGSTAVVLSLLGIIGLDNTNALGHDVFILILQMGLALSLVMGAWLSFEMTRLSRRINRHLKQRESEQGINT